MSSIEKNEELFEGSGLMFGCNSKRKIEIKDEIIRSR